MIDNWPNERWVPDSCCKTTVLDCGKAGNADLWYSNGCSEQIVMWFIQRLHIVGVVGLAVAFIQVGRNGIVFSTMLLNIKVLHFEIKMFLLKLLGRKQQ